MADGGGYASSYLPALSRLMGEVEQPTNTSGLVNPQFGGSPEQLMGILQHPQTQQLMQQLGIHFDPSTLRQSPFLSNRFMQGHPLLGGALTGAMANAAATPEAPLVSGAGSGISRAMQGMSGGPEMLRQYQVRQMLAPMQAMGSMIPGQEFQRKQQLLQLLQKMEEDRQAQATRHEQFVEQSPAGRLQNEIYAPPNAPGYFTREQARPEGGPQGLDFQMTGQRAPMIPPSGPGAGQPMPQPGFGPTPATAGGPLFHPYDTSQVAEYAKAKETPAQRAQREGKGALDEATANLKQAYIDAGYPDAQAEALAAKAVKDRATAARGGQGSSKGWTEKGASQLEEKKGTAISKLNGEFATHLSKYGKLDKEGKNTFLDEEQWKKDDPGTYNEYFRQRQEIEDQYTEAGRALGGTYPGYEYSSRGQRSTTKQNPFVSPGASPGSAQAGGAGSQKSEGTAVQGATGLPPGYVFNEQGIPVPAAQQPPKQ